MLTQTVFFSAFVFLGRCLWCRATAWHGMEVGTIMIRLVSTGLGFCLYGFSLFSFLLREASIGESFWLDIVANLH